MDVDAIQPGRDFRHAIDESIHKCSVLLAIVGHRWLESRNALGVRRLDEEDDLVRIEIASALRRNIPVIPVLVRGARMPRAEELPEDLRELAYRNAVELTHARWKSDVQVLIRALRPYLEYPEGANSLRGEAHDEHEIPSAVGIEQKPVGEAKPVVNFSEEERAVIERVGRELARYIGPVADIVVRRAAKRCGSLADLAEMVAPEIEVREDRARFLALCRR
jgi:hypothetical protein